MSFVIKSSLEHFFSTKQAKDILFPIIQENVGRIDKITVEVYHLINLHIRRLLEENKPITKIDQEYITLFIYAVTKKEKILEKVRKKMKK